MDVLTTYTRDSELQEITAPPLIFTIHKSPQHPLSLFQPAVPPPAAPRQRLLIAKILHALKSSLHRPPYRTDYKLSTLALSLAYNNSARTTQKTQFFYCCVLIRCRRDVFAAPLGSNDRGADHRKHRSSVVPLLHFRRLLGERFY
jgi:hypothetical protein